MFNHDSYLSIYGYRSLNIDHPVRSSSVSLRIKRYRLPVFKIKIGF
jgi:hypothetical protein